MLQGFHVKGELLYRSECERKIFYSFVKHLFMKMLNKNPLLSNLAQVYDLFLLKIKMLPSFIYTTRRNSNLYKISFF